MAVYNRIGGGANRVTLDGKPPTERVNLKSIDTKITHKNFLPYKLKKLMSYQNGKILYIADNTRETIIEKEIGKLPKEVGNLPATEFEGILIKDNTFYTLGLPGMNDDSLIIYKFENGEKTIIRQIDNSFSGYKRLNLGFFLNDTVYIETYSSGQMNNKSYFKGTNFGEIWTDITSQIVNNTGIDTKFLFTSSAINIGNKRYIFSHDGIFTFDGNTFDIFEKKDVGMYLATNDCTDYRKAYIVEVKQLYKLGITQFGKSKVTIYKIENNGENTSFNVEKEFESYTIDKSNNDRFILNTKDVNVFWKELGEENGLCYIEEPVKAYIEDREKG